VEAICGQAFLDVNIPDAPMARRVFTRHLMPYAKIHWQYDGKDCNCADLAQAMVDVWYYIKSTKKPRFALSPAENTTVAGPLIARPLPVFAGPARGNINASGTGELDGRCYFANHSICKIGTTYFDPTYDQISADPQYFVERKVKILGALRIATDGSLLYARNLAAAPKFSDSWDEMPGAGWINAADWRSKTARTGHTRSDGLQAVDAKLLDFQNQGSSALKALRTAFTNWYSHNPKEAQTRDKDGCVTGLKTFLGV
jgi:hypothetical protein